MRTKNFYNIIFLVLSFIFLLSCAEHKDSNDLLNNKSKNLNINVLLNATEFDELFKIKNKIDLKGLLLGKIIRLKIFPDGDIGVIDASTKQLNIFNSNGIFLNTIGANGRGPGEYLNATDFAFDDSLNTYILDAVLYQLLCYSKSGEYKWTLKLDTYNEHMIISNNNIYFYSTLNMIDRPCGVCYSIKNKNKLFEFAEPTPFIKAMIKSRNLSLAVNSNSIEYYQNKLYLIHPYQYAIREFNLFGKETKLMHESSNYFIEYDSSKEFNPISITPKEYFKSATNGIKIWNDLIFLSFLSIEKNKLYLDIYNLEGKKVIQNTIALPEKYFDRKDYFPLWVDINDHFYASYLNLNDVEKQYGGNPTIIQYEFSPQIKTKK